MFRHVLIPVDGSPLATRAAKAGVAFARRSGAKLTVYHAINPLPYGFYATGADPGDRISVQLERRARAQGEKHVAVIVRAARAAGVPCQSRVEVAVPDEGIVACARRRGCDSIFLGSHGHRGMKRLLLGSVASRVLARAAVPVVVYR
jgi:nucleotide-binding universal stress UspA family protein